MIRRILPILASSGGVTAITAMTAEAGRKLNHCEPRLRPQAPENV